MGERPRLRVDDGAFGKEKAADVPPAPTAPWEDQLHNLQDVPLSFDWVLI